jgi:uncharacterized membrane protein YsdA (DUF1294 family)
MIFLLSYLAIGVPILSVIAFVIYWYDKQQAIHLSARIPESTLLAVGQFGGWPGAWLAQKILRHKSSKLSFQIKFIATVVGHVFVVTVIAVWLYIASLTSP